jgi:hypothetical protein
MNATDTTIKELREVEEVMAVLDQHAAPNGTAIGRAYSRMYAELAKLRDRELAEWNADPQSYGGTQQIHRCVNAQKPYHTDADGVCDVYGTTPLCELCEQTAIDAAEKLKAERGEYLAAKRRGEDV